MRPINVGARIAGIIFFVEASHKDEEATALSIALVSLITGQDSSVSNIRDEGNVSPFRMRMSAHNIVPV